MVAVAVREKYRRGVMVVVLYSVHQILTYMDDDRLAGGGQEGAKAGREGMGWIGVTVLQCLVRGKRSDRVQ